MEKKLYITRYFSLLCAFIFVLAGSGCSGIISEKASGGTYYLTEEADTVEQQSSPEGSEEAVVTADDKEQEESTEISYVYVQVCGAVHSPGVYRVESTLRVFEVIELAGGETLEADIQAINMARPVTDEMRIYVPTTEEVNSGSYGNMYQENNDAIQKDFAQASTGALEDDKASGLVDINTAGKDILMTLPGIGESRALAIISYREENGPFNSIEDIMKVTGIKQAAFEKLKDRIKI